jgi:ribosomal protein L11 methylase PrmA
VLMPARLQGVATRPGTDRRVRGGRLSRAAFRELLSTLRRWIDGLEPRGIESTTWGAYDALVPDRESDSIAAFIREFVGQVAPRMVWDLGCNAGRYSESALGAGAGYVVGIDSDPGAIEQAFRRARERKLRLLSLLVDLVNPSPGQGWLDRERAGLLTREHPDALIAIAVIHHMAIARNIPLEEIVLLLTKLAPDGVVGFVPATDARAAALFRGREDLFHSYSLEHFLSLLQHRARIVRQQPVPGGDRALIWFSTR